MHYLQAKQSLPRPQAQWLLSQIKTTLLGLWLQHVLQL
jgi:hypothetical protein